MRTVALDPLPSHGRGTARPPDSVDKARKLELLTRADEAARAASDAITQVRSAAATAAGGSSSPTRRACSPRTTRSGRASASSCVANGDTGMQTGYESLARTEGYEIFERHAVEDIAELAATPGADQTFRPPGTLGRGAHCAGWRQRRHPLPRGVRPRSRGRPHRQGRVGLYGPGRAARGQPAGHAGRRRHRPG